MDASTTGKEPGASWQKTSSSASCVWKYFTKDETGTTVTCKICKSVLQYKSVMHIHLKMHPLMIAEEKSKFPRQQSVSGFTKCPAILCKTSPFFQTEKRRLKITNLLVNFIVKDIRPLAAVHGEIFRELSTALFLTLLHCPILQHTGILLNTNRTACRKIW